MIGKNHNCTNCEACINICPKRIITKQVDKYGQEHAVVDEDKCVNCDLCEKVCPEITSSELHSLKQCYAAYREDDAKRLDSASGGIGAYFYEKAMETAMQSSVIRIRTCG